MSLSKNINEETSRIKPVLAVVKQGLRQVVASALANPKMFLIFLGIVLLLIYVFAGNQHADLANREFSGEPKPELSWVKDAVDPRAKWTEEIAMQITHMRNDMQVMLEENKKQVKEEVEAIVGRVINLEEAMQEKELTPVITEDIPIRAIEEQIEKTSVVPVKKTLKHFHRASSRKTLKNLKDYMPAGSHVRAVFLNGLMADTGAGGSSASGKPTLMRIVDFGKFCKDHRIAQIKEATVIASCIGNISSERAECTLQKISLVNRNGEIIEKTIEGWVMGEDGAFGVRGNVIDKSSDIARLALISGLTEGVAKFFENQSLTSMYTANPLMPLARTTMSARDAVKGGVASGAGNALNKMTEYILKRADQLMPVLEIASGRVVDLVFQNGFSLILDEMSMQRPGVKVLEPLNTPQHVQNNTPVEQNYTPKNNSYQEAYDYATSIEAPNLNDTGGY